MKSFEYTITDPVGIHARPAGLLVKEIKNFAGTTVTIKKGEKAVNALKLYYVCQVKQPSGKHLHTLAVDYVITLP